MTFSLAVHNCLIALAIGADPAGDPVDWVFTDMSDRQLDQSIGIRRGRDDEAGQGQPTSSSFELDNPDGALTPGFATSPYDPNMRRGMPCQLSTTGETHLLTTGADGSHASTPHHSSLDITGDLSGIIELAPLWMPAPATTFEIAGRYTTSGNQRSWLVDWWTDGRLRFNWSTDGTSGGALSMVSTKSLPRPDTMSALGWWLDVSNAGNRVLTWYWARTRAEILASPAAHILEQIITAGTTSINAGTAPLEIGDVGGVSTANLPLPGMVRSFQLRSGDLSTGTVVADVDFEAAAVGATTVVDATGKTWSFAGGAKITDQITTVLQVDEITADWPEGDISHPETDDPGEARAAFTVSGPLRRLGQGDKPLESAIFRRVTSPLNTSAIKAYWPMEDESGAVTAASPIPGVAPMSVNGLSFGSAPDYVASKKLASVSGGDPAGWSGVVPPHTSTSWSVECFVNIPTITATLVPVMVVGANGKSKVWSILASNSAVLIGANDVNGDALVFTTFAADSRFFGVWAYVRLQVVQNGSNVDWDVRWLPIYGSGAGTAFGTSGSFAGTTGIATGVRNLMTAAPPDGLSIGHIIVASGKSLGWLAPADSAFVGEAAGTRYKRLCDEENIANTIVGTPSDSALMGPQLPVPLPTLLNECATTDMGMMGDQRHRLGLLYRTHRSLENQSPALVLDAATDSDIAPPFSAVLDDQRLRNDVTVDRPGGSSARAIDGDSVAAEGLYDDSVTVNVASDGQLPDQAGWRLHLGTRPGMRYPKLTSDLTVAPHLITSYCWLREGDRVQVVNLPPQHPSDTVDILVEGSTETIDPVHRFIELNCSPADSWNVGVLDDDVLGKLDTDGSELADAIDTDDTTWDVATTSGPLWTTDDAEFPFEIIAAGEVWNVTDIAASLITFGATGTATHGNNASITPGIPASVAAGNLLLCLAAIRNSGAGVPNTPAGYVRLPVFADTSNVQLFAKIATSASETAPTITFTGGVANADTSAQMIRVAGKFHDANNLLVAMSDRLNASAQNIAYPALKVDIPNCLILYLGWKQDDWTSVATLSGATEIGEPATTTGNDQGIVWDYQIQTTATDIAAGSFAVTGGAAAISRGAVLALRCDKQTFTATRAVNGVHKAHPAGTSLRLAHPLVLAL